MCKGSLLSVSSLIFVIFGLLDNSYSNKYEVISQGGFDLHFMMINDFEHLEKMCFKY